MAALGPLTQLFGVPIAHYNHDDECRHLLVAEKTNDHVVTLISYQAPSTSQFDFFLQNVKQPNA